MKKSVLVLSALIACVGMVFMGCANAAEGDSSTSSSNSANVTTKNQTAATNLYANSSVKGFDIAVWGSWATVTAPIAEVTNGSDGGIRMTSIARPDDGTYMGINVAAGSGSGANADINGNGFTKIKCKIRGTVNPAYCSIYIIQGAGNAGTEIGKTTMLSSYVSSLSSTSWTDITVAGLSNTAALSSALVFFADNDGSAVGDWCEIKEIDFLDDSGNSVVPAYNE